MVADEVVDAETGIVIHPDPIREPGIDDARVPGELEVMDGETVDITGIETGNLTGEKLFMGIETAAEIDVTASHLVERTVDKGESDIVHFDISEYALGRTIKQYTVFACAGDVVELNVVDNPQFNPFLSTDG